VSDDLAEGTVSVCVCTYRRPDQLARLIARLGVQRVPPAILELVVADNDPNGSARTAVESAIVPFRIRYEIQPLKNIALTRNLSVRLAGGDWLAFLDDDELPAQDWLRQLYETAARSRADGVLGPVIAELPTTAPSWIQRGDFFSRQRLATGTIVPRMEYRIGNALIRADWLRRFDGPFDPCFGLSGGEDGQLLNQLANSGARIVWCDEAVVTEPVDPSRLNRQWLLLRAYRAGQNFTQHTRTGAYGSLRFYTIPLLAMAAFGKAAIASVMTILVRPLGQTASFRWLRRAFANAGKLTALINRQYQEYR